MIKTYNQWINESKQAGILYHLVGFEKLNHIVETGKLEPKNFYALSFTRNKMLNYYNGQEPSTFGKFEIDGDKLSNNYKIEPYDDRVEGAHVGDEFEERIKRQIKDIFKYINKFIIIEEIIEHQRDLDDLNMFLSRKIKASIINSINTLIKKYRTNIYLQKLNGQFEKLNFKNFDESEYNKLFLNG